MEDVLLLPDSLSGFVDSIGADEAHCEEVVRRAETARGEVALEPSVSRLLPPASNCGWERTDLVLDGLVAAGWGEVLTHGF